MEKVAKISKLYGSDGSAVINLFSGFPDDFSLADPIFIKVDSLNVPLYFESFERRGRSSAVVKFADLDSERRIMEFMGCDLLLAEYESEDVDDEFFMEDLVGFKVEVIADKPLVGVMSDYIHSESNPLFEIEIDGRKVLVPAAEEFIHSIDFDGQIIRFILPDGLLDL
ncbi:MAG: ribosome maturation factor RimM [Rikenellaceae bacterium]